MSFYLSKAKPMTHFQTTCQALIAMAAESLASAPHLTPAQKKTRTEAVICGIMAFLPSEPVQSMLAAQAVGHHVMLMDTFQQICGRALDDKMACKMRMAAALETRMMLALVRELRVVRKDMIAAAEAEQAAAQEAAAQTETAPEAPPETTDADSQAEGDAIEDPAFQAHIVDFENAWHAVQETLAEARALDPVDAPRANGHLAAVAPRVRAGSPSH